MDRQQFIEHHLGKPFELGRTARQMADAPHGAVFVWHQAGDRYPRGLARALGRDDLQIVGADWVQARNLRGCRVHLVVDHYAWTRLTTAQFCGIVEAHRCGSVISYS